MSGYLRVVAILLISLMVIPAVSTVALFYVAVWLCAVAVYLELRSILKQKIKKNSEIAISLVVTAIVAIHALAFLLLILFLFFVFKMITRQGCINAYHVWRKKLAEKVVGSDFSMHSKGYN